MNTELYQNICQELEEIRSSGNPYWNAGPETISLLVHHIKNIPECRMLEIGTSNGFTALRLVPALLDVQGSLVTIESHRERGDMALQNFERTEITDVVSLVRGHAPEVFSAIEGAFDLVFLDATKYEHRSYVEFLLPRMKSNCVIISDNVLSHTEAMKPFVDYMSQVPGFVVEIQPIEAGVLIAERHV